MSLQNQRIVVLGGTSGLGFATAQAAAKDGASLVVVSSRPESVDRAKTALGAGTEGFVCNLSDENKIKELFERIGPFDHLVYTAGENLRLNVLSETSLDNARQFFNVRYWGAFAAVKYATPFIRGNGSIVLTSGTAGARPQKGWTVAASICGAMDGLTRALAVELAPIRVNAVCPGVVKSPLWNAMSSEQRETMYHNEGARLPVGRVGEVEDIAEAYLYLMRERFSTGQITVVDGGTMLA
jgi:NAD(P)-dependent dehydrogenase (short-subunit alcohol dehydrogenase family)